LGLHYVIKAVVFGQVMSSTCYSKNSSHSKQVFGAAVFIIHQNDVKLTQIIVA